MAPRKIRVATETRDLIRGLHPDLKKKARSALNQILADPQSGKALQAELEGLWSFRIGKMRIIYRWDKSIIEIIALGPRKTIYEETLRLIRRTQASK